MAEAPLRLLHAPGWSPGARRAALEAAGIALAPHGPLDGIVPDGRPTVLLADPATLGPGDAAVLARLAPEGVALALAAAPPDTLPDAVAAHVAAVLPDALGGRAWLLGLRGAFRAAQQARELARRADELGDVTQIGISLLTERDYHTLLARILTLARDVTHSDAGSLYLVERGEDGGRRLRFALVQNASRPGLPFEERTLPLDRRSLAGWAAETGAPLVIADAYALPADAPYAFHRAIDDQAGYRTRSLLVVPMPNHQGEVIGVLQLINRRRDDGGPLGDAADVEARVGAYDEHDVRLARALAGQAAVSLENSQLHEAIERLFEGFVRAAVLAIEQRDPTTFGHSERVARLTVGLAQAVDRHDAGPYAATRFTADHLRELRYAALLHDFGKVGVREHVLVKGKKLYAGGLELVRQRHETLVRDAERRFERARAEALLREGPAGAARLPALEAAHRAELAELARFLETVERCNEPAMLVEPEGEAHRALAAFAARTYEGLDGRSRPFLTPQEFQLLSIRRGTLDDAERQEIESHVTHTYGFLQRIPWTPGLRGVPEIALGHHEKLDGSGYPRGVRGDAIPVQTRMMTIADVFDALTAQDRPYKPAMAAERALGVLEDEARLGAVDAELLRLFVAAEVWRRP